MRSFTCVSVVVYVARKLRPCPSYSRRRDRINLVLWRSLDKGGGGVQVHFNDMREEMRSFHIEWLQGTIDTIEDQYHYCTRYSIRINQCR